MSAEYAGAVVRGFPEEHPDCPLPLRRKILRHERRAYRSN
jgi:hypothetical protein